MAFWYILLNVICYIFPRFGILDQEKSGNPGPADAQTYLAVVKRPLTDICLWFQSCSREAIPIPKMCF
jgi:hypothetical protein